ncbi:MAG: ABC transporter ATP-binding protein [Chloroflexota bacterium]
MSNGKNGNSNVTTFSVMAKALATIFRRMWFIFVLLFMTAVGVTLLELVPPLLLKNIVDNYLNVHLASGIWTAATLYLLASLGTGSLGFVQVFITTYIGQHVLLELRLLMAEHLTKLPISYYNRTPVGETMSRVTSDVDAVNTLFTSGITSALADAFKVIGVVIAMYVISPTLCLIALAAVPVVYLVADYFRRNIYRTQLMVRRAVGVINTFLQEIFNGMKIVKTYGREEQYDAYFQDPLKSHLKAINHAAVYESYFPCVTQVIRAATIALVLWVGARTGLNDRVAITIGGLAAMADLMTRLFTPIEALSQEFQTIQRAMSGIRRIVELLQEKPEEKGNVEHIPSLSLVRGNNRAVDIKNMSFGYQPGKTILKNISLSIPQGKKIAIVGRTGAGKTTLLNLIAGLYAADTGTISVLGFNPYRVDPVDRRELLGVVPQNVHLFEGTIRENITLRDRLISDDDMEKAAKMVGLHDYLMSLDQGYDTLLGVEGTRLSFGQSQLLSLARAIVSDPALLLLDEPTSGMDAATEADIFRAFRTVSQDRAIITISHRLSGIIDADEVHIMASGRIVQSGTPEKLAGESGWYSVFRQLEDLGWKMD